MGLINLLNERIGVISSGSEGPTFQGVIIADEKPTTGGPLPDEDAPKDPLDPVSGGKKPIGFGEEDGAGPPVTPGSRGSGSGWGPPGPYGEGFGGRIPLMDPHAPSFPRTGTPLRGSGSGTVGGRGAGGGNSDPGDASVADYLEALRRGPTVHEDQFKDLFGHPIARWEREVVKRAFQIFYNDTNLRATIESLSPELYERFRNMMRDIHIARGGPCIQSNGQEGLAITTSYETESGDIQWLIILCDAFFDLTFEMQIATLLHEYMHVFGYSELDSYLIEYIMGLRDGDILPDYNSSDPDERARALAVWCSIKYDAEPPDNNAHKEFDGDSNLIIRGKHYELNVSTGELWDRSKPRHTWTRPETNLAALMPPLDWWSQVAPSDGCTE